MRNSQQEVELKRCSFKGSTEPIVTIMDYVHCARPWTLDRLQDVKVYRITIQASRDQDLGVFL